MGTEHAEHAPEVASDTSTERLATHPALEPRRPVRTSEVATLSASLPVGGDSVGRVRRAAASASAQPSPGPLVDQSAPPARVRRSMDRDRLPEPLRTGIEQLSGMSLDDVRVQRSSPRPAKVGALAYAQGDQIHLGPGQEQHLPHEAWHVVQQRQGRVRQTVQHKDAAINDDDALEREADVMGARALALGVRASRTPETATSLPSAAPPMRVVRRSTARGVMQLLSAKDKKLLGPLKTADTLKDMTKQERWTAIRTALGASGTKQNVIDGAKHLAVEVEEPPEAEPVAMAKPAKQRTVDDKVWAHITQGGTNKKGGPTGYHTTRGQNAIAVGEGPKTMLEFGCYRQSVRLLADGAKTEKKTPSTFFPDDWTLDEIREAIEHAASIGGPQYEVLTPAKGRGMKLFKNADSWFPYFA